MATIHEAAARALLDGILLDPDAAADYAAFRAGLADAPEDAVHRFEDFGQLFHARHPGKWPLEQSAALYEFCIGLSAGERARLEIAVSGTPGADRERQANAETLRSLPAPFTAQVDMLQNGADCDGWFTWNTSIVLRSDPREGPRQAYLVEPHSVPLEIGYCMPSRALLHIRQARGVARWAYGSTHITLFYDLRGVPMAEKARHHPVVRQVTLPPLRDLGAATDVLCDLLFETEGQATDPDVAVNLEARTVDIRLTVYATDQAHAEAIAERIINDAVVEAVLGSAAKRVAGETARHERLIAGRIREAVQASGRPLSEIAQAVGVDEAILAAAVSGEQVRLKPLAFAKLADLLGVASAWLLASEPDGYELLAASEDEEDRAFHRAMRGRRRDRTVLPADAYDALAADLDAPPMPNERTREAARRLGDVVELLPDESSAEDGPR